MNFDYATMGNRIKLRRKELHITQSQFAEKLNISNNHLSSIENGNDRPSFELFLRICEELNVTPDALTLGIMHTNNAPKQVSEMLKQCTPDQIELVQHILEYFSSKK